MITKFARLEFELFTKPSKSDFLRVHHFWDGYELATAFISWFLQHPTRFSSGQTHLDANTGRMLHDGEYLFPRETRRGYAAPKSNAFTLRF